MATKKKIPKASKRRLMIFGTLSIVVMGYFFVTLITYTIRINDLKEEEKNLNNELIALKEDAEELENTIQKLKDPDYVARYARENYFYSKDGEYIIKIEEDEKEVVKEEKKEYKYQYYIYGGASILVAIFLYILKRK